MTKSKRILLWSGEYILAQSIPLFLNGRQDWTVISIPETDDPHRWFQAVARLQPDVVILPQSCQQAGLASLLQLLTDCPAIKVISISLENNTMEVYSKQKIMVQQVSDLLAAIEDGA